MDCKNCSDTGIIETGNNDLPCYQCPLGDTAVWGIDKGKIRTGRDVKAELKDFRTRRDKS